MNAATIENLKNWQYQPETIKKLNEALRSTGPFDPDESIDRMDFIRSKGYIATFEVWSDQENKFIVNFHFNRKGEFV